MSAKKQRIGTLISLHKCLSGPKSANSKTVSYTRPQADAMLEAIKGLLKNDGIGFMPADSKVGES
ncbi:MAG TPA: hypothetical protein EYN67_14800 [Flavobacteriales bacterium]|nr:hypothetical protein [Flavobacteriales bacterium]HIB76083.1 hypothetical protein [Flavobacteriales bacterium]